MRPTPTLEQARALMEGCDDSEWANYMEGLVRARERENAELLQELGSSRCPRPANDAPWDLTVNGCMARRECGCSAGAAIAKARGEA